MSSTSVDHTPTGKWAFDDDVAECFTDMLVRSIPLWEETLDLIANLVCKHLRSGDTLVDLGVSRGDALCRIHDRLKSRGLNDIRLIGVDNSAPMLDRARSALPESAELIEHDLGRGLPYRVTAAKPTVVLCLWTAQFIPMEHRYTLFRQARESINPRGAMFVAEKLRGQTSRHQEYLVRAYEEWKIEQGYTREAVREKAVSLEGVLVSQSAPEFKQAAQAEGWWPEEVIRYLGFAAWHMLPR
jgi:tRNA (cmo5U34)-methyltransferase